MIDIQEVADAADVIVNGYAFTKCHLGFRVLNLNHPECAHRQVKCWKLQWMILNLI